MLSPLALDLLPNLVFSRWAYYLLFIIHYQQEAIDALAPT